MKKIEILPVEAGEVEAIGALARIVWQKCYAGIIISQEQVDYMLGDRYNAARLREELQTPGIWWDQAFVDGERVGFASTLRTDTPGELKLDKLYIHPAHQRHGVGGAMIAHIAERGLKDDPPARTLILAVNKQNLQAQAAYRKHGFVQREPVYVDIGNGFVMDDYIMEKALR